MLANLNKINNNKCRVNLWNKENLERKIKWLFVFLGIAVTPYAHTISNIPYRSDNKELKKRIRALEENQE